MGKIMKSIVNGICCHFLYHVKYINLEMVKDYPKCLICPSHSNIFDPTFFYPKIDNLWIMAKKEIFKNKILAKIWKHYQVFPVDRKVKDVGSVLQSLSIFEENKAARLLLFPEGGIPKKEETEGSRVKKGACFFAATLEIPIIPVYITRYPKLFSKVYVVFGQPLFVSKQVLKNKEKLKEESSRLVQTIFLLGKEKLE